MTSVGLRAVTGIIGRYGIPATLRPDAVRATVAGVWGVGAEVQTLTGHVILQLLGDYSLLPTIPLVGREFRVEGSNTWHRVRFVSASTPGGFATEGRALLTLVPPVFSGEMIAGAPVFWAKGFAATSSYAVHVVRRKRQAIYYDTAARFFGETLFLIDGAELRASGYPAHEGFFDGVGLSVEGFHYVIASSRPVVDGGEVAYWEVLAVLPLEQVVASFIPTPLQPGIFTLEVSGDFDQAWRWRIQRFEVGGWLDFTPQLEVVPGRVDLSNDSPRRSAYRAVGVHRDGGFYIADGFSVA